MQRWSIGPLSSTPDWGVVDVLFFGKCQLVGTEAERTRWVSTLNILERIEVSWTARLRLHLPPRCY